MRIELHPATDLWMMGDCYGELLEEGDDYVVVLLDKSQRRIFLPTQDIYRRFE